MSASILHAPPDVDAAYDRWGANCGPCALAAALGCSVDDLRAAVSEPAKQLELGEPPLHYRGYMDVGHMRRALAAMRVPILRTWRDQPAEFLASLGDTQERAVIVMVLWSGPWNAIPRAAATHRHFIAYRHVCVGAWGPGWTYDGNAQGWLPHAIWAQDIAPQLIPKRGDGTWTIGWAAELGDRPTV